MEFSDLYSNTILEIAGRARAMPRLEHADGSARKVSRVCGSSVEVDVKVADGRIIDYGADISACALGQTSAAIIAEHIVGRPADELRRLRDQMLGMLKSDGPAPEGVWDDLKYLRPVRGFPVRHASTMLVFEAVVAALDEAGA